MLPPPTTDRLSAVPLQEPTRRQRPEWETELLDFTASGHPLAQRRLRPGEQADFGNVLEGGDEGGAWVRDVECHWGWMHYAVQSLMDALLKDGCAVLERGHYDEKLDATPNPKTPELGLRFESSPC